MTRLWRWLRGVLRWIAEPHLAWLTVLVITLALVVSLREGVGDLQVRTTGLVLQWLGIGTVAYGVRETRKLFARPSLLTLFRGWISRFPPWRRQIVMGAGGVSVSVGVGSGRGHVWSPVDSAQPVEQQLLALKRNIERLDKQVDEMRGEIESMTRKQSDALGLEKQAREAADHELHKRLEAAETGGLHMTLIGVIWLFLGVLLATLSPEIVRWRS